MSSTAGAGGGHLELATDAGQRGGAGRGHECRRPSPDLDELGQDGDRDFLGRLGAQVDPGGRAQRGDPFRPEHRLLGQPLADDGGAGRRGDQADIGRLAGQCGRGRLLVPDPLGRDDDRGPGARVLVLDVASRR